MKLYRIFLIMMLGMGAACAQDSALRTAVTSDIGSEWCNHFWLCQRVVRYKGQGKDDEAFKQLLSGATGQAKIHLKIALKWGDPFWKLVATAGAPKSDCGPELTALLISHFGVAPKDLGDAAKDADTSNFLALSDLLRVASVGLPGAVDRYRFCFDDPDNLFTKVKDVLAQ